MVVAWLVILVNALRRDPGCSCIIGSILMRCEIEAVVRYRGSTVGKLAMAAPHYTDLVVEGDERCIFVLTNKIGIRNRIRRPPGRTLIRGRSVIDPDLVLRGVGDPQYAGRVLLQHDRASAAVMGSLGIGRIRAVRHNAGQRKTRSSIERVGIGAGII